MWWWWWLRREGGLTLHRIRQTLTIGGACLEDSRAALTSRKAGGRRRFATVDKERGGLGGRTACLYQLKSSSRELHNLVGRSRGAGRPSQKP